MKVIKQGFSDFYKLVIMNVCLIWVFINTAGANMNVETKNL